MKLTVRLVRALLLVALGVLFSCTGGGGFGALGGAACPALTSGDPMAFQFSANAKANAKVKAFVVAARSLVDVSIEMEALATKACSNMGRDLGIPDAQMAPKGDEPGASVKAACGALSARIDMILKSGIGVRAQVQAPQCQADFQAKARCDAACDVQVDPGQIIAQCEPGKLSGYCQGRCDGRCEGTCQGQCNGQCSAVDAQGNCNGQCNGTCSGGCSATCHASCQGQWQAPKCEGHVTPPSVDAECNASCSATANLRAQCTPGQVMVQTNANTEAAMRLVQTLQVNLPWLIKAELGLGRRVAGDVKTVVQIGGQLPKIVGDAGAQAMACIAGAAHASAQASVRINVSIQASASVNGKVAGHAG